MSDPTVPELLASAVQAAAAILSRRLVLLAVLGLDFILFAWNAYSPDYARLASAVLFGLIGWVSISYPRQ